MTETRRPARLWDVPTAVWLYGFLRAAAFGVPVATGTGRVGLGLLITLVLYVFLVRGSWVAWVLLISFDVLGFVLLVLATPLVDEAPLILHIFAGLALLTLLLPSVRRHVSRRTTSSDQPSGPAASRPS